MHSTYAAAIDWKALLDCVNLVTIISFTLGLVGVFVGILGYVASRRSLRESAEAKAQTQTAQQAAAAARQKLLLQRAAEDFRAIVDHVQNLTASVTSSEWDSAKKLLIPVKRQLSEADGSFQQLLKGIDMDRLDVAIRAVKLLMKAVQETAAAQAVVPADTVQAMIAECDRIGDLVGQIYGRLKYLEVEDIR